MTEHVYRFRYETELTPEGVKINILKARVVRKTPKGAWVVQVWEYPRGVLMLSGKKFFVLDGPGKRRYHETLEQAWASFKIRKAAALRHAKHRMRMAEVSMGFGKTFTIAPTLSHVIVPEWLGEYDFSEY